MGNAYDMTIKHNRGGLFDVQAQPSPTRGTLFKSPSTNMPTYWHESVGPQFEMSQSVFKVGSKINLDKSPSRVSFEAAQRLAQRPAHKPPRTKYDTFDQKSQKEKRNTTQTAEDKIDRNTVYWTTSLRPLDPATKFLSSKKSPRGAKNNRDLDENVQGNNTARERLNRLD